MASDAYAATDPNTFDTGEGYAPTLPEGWGAGAPVASGSSAGAPDLNANPWAWTRDAQQLAKAAEAASGVIRPMVHGLLAQPPGSLTYDHVADGVAHVLDNVRVDPRLGHADWASMAQSAVGILSGISPDASDADIRRRAFQFHTTHLANYQTFQALTGRWGVGSDDDSGQDDSGQDDSGQDDSGQDDSGQDDSGQDDSGQDNSGAYGSGAAPSPSDSPGQGDAGGSAGSVASSAGAADAPSGTGTVQSDFAAGSGPSTTAAAWPQKIAVRSSGAPGAVAPALHPRRPKIPPRDPHRLRIAMVDPDGRPTGQFEDTTPAQSETYWGLIKKGIFDPNAPPGSPKRPMAIPSDGRMPIHGGDWYVQRDDGALKQYVDPDTLEHTAEAAALRYAVPVVGDWIQRRYFPDPRLDAFQDGAWDGVTLGTGKYAASFFDAAPALLTGNFNETYQRDLAGREALDRQERQRYPWFHFAGEAAGGVAPMLLTDGLAAPVREGVLGWRALQGAGDLSRIARAAAPAVVDMAAQGTANAVHAAADTQGDLTQKAKALPGGFVAGALPAGAAHSAGALLDLGASRLLNARYEPQRLATYSDDVLPKPGEATSPAVDSPLPAPSEDPPPSTTPPSLHGDQPSLLQSLKKKSLRLLYLGRTPSKYSAVGNKVVNRMRTENKIFGEGPLLRGNPNNLHIINDDNSLTFIDHNVDMAHKQAAVSWWNSVGRQFGARSRQAREFMLDDSNYELQHRTQNRSEGGAMTERYMPPIGLSDPPPPGIFP